MKVTNHENPLSASVVSATLELMDEKYMDPPGQDATDGERHAHGDIRELIGLCRGLAAAVLALSRPVVVQASNLQQPST